MPAGIIPVNGARDAVLADFANRRRCGKSVGLAVALSPRLRGEMSGRTVRGSADRDLYAQ
ncbi:hypothetical protein FJ954_23990 [Mesorhizobium sp. B2-3-15]|nr:hypothetical protein FJ954_23990 [Mesorhizobium sp. B2-3-15]